MSGTDRRRIGWDLALVLFTALTLAGFGVLALFGMFYYKIHAVRPDWSVVAYQGMMNRLAAPLTVLLIVWLVLCIPKRVFSRRALLAYSAVILALATAAVPFGGVQLGLALALGLSALLQTVILGLVLAGARLHFARRGLALRVGSSLVHLGFVLFTLNLVAFKGSPLHLPIFWVAIAALCGGCVLTFYFPHRRAGGP